MILEEGFAWNGQTFGSLSSHCGGEARNTLACLRA
jgi:hypothetical protein